MPIIYNKPAVKISIEKRNRGTGYEGRKVRTAAPLSNISISGGILANKMVWYWLRVFIIGIYMALGVTITVLQLKRQ